MGWIFGSPKGVFTVYVHFTISFPFSSKDGGAKKDKIRLAKERREEKDRSQGKLQVFYSVITEDILLEIV